MLEAGQSLLHYTLIEKIGEGGMGVVWKAQDTTLGREVAIKVLPPAFAADAERLARFEREARLLAALNHPHIAAIYGCHVEPMAFLVMELIEGDDLSTRLQRGTLPQGQALLIMMQVAQALERAHESGIIHRDLKPANIKLDREGQAKVLDFGLAKAVAPSGSDPSLAPSMSPTMTSAGTVAGMILGTATYMSPEQAKGNEVDRRTDVWSFGVLLYELLCGRRLFGGQTISETLAEVIMKEIDLKSLPAETPGQARRLLDRCLDRDPQKRLRDIGEARVLLAEALESPEAATVGDARPAWRRWAPWGIALGASLLALVGWLAPGDHASDADVMRFAMTLPEGHQLPHSVLPGMTLSPDGTRLVYYGRETVDDPAVLLVRRMDRIDPVKLNGTEGATTPVFSPDGRWVAFEQDGQVRKVSIDGGPVITLCDAPRIRGMHWGPGGIIALAPDRSSAIFTVSENGGTLTAITTLEADSASLSEPSQRWPHILPDGRHVLFTDTPNNSFYNAAEIRAVPIDGGDSKIIVQGSYPVYLQPGYLLFTRGPTLFAAPFDLGRVEMTGPAIPVIEGVRESPFFGLAHFAVSANGMLIYSGGGVGDLDSQLVWVTRTGERADRPPIDSNGIRAGYRVSPDGQRIVGGDGQIIGDIWVGDIERGTRVRFTMGAEHDLSPVWSPDGQWIAFASFRDKGINIYRQRADGTGDDEPLTDESLNLVPKDWSPDGTKLVLVRRETAIDQSGETKDADIYLLHLEDPNPPRLEPFMTSDYVEEQPRFSRDGRWLAYVSTENGESEVYVRRVDGTGGKISISTGGGSVPMWSPTRNELVYRKLDGQLFSVVQYKIVGDRFVPSPPEPIFSKAASSFLNIEFGPQGDTFLVLPSADIRGQESMPTVVVNWAEELRERVDLQ